MAMGILGRGHLESTLRIYVAHYTAIGPIDLST